MNFKKFISGVSAIAIAASAFAAMTVTASAATNRTIQPKSADVTVSNFTFNSSGVFTAAAAYTSNPMWSGASVDFSGYPNIAKASRVQLDFDATVNNDGYVMIGVGDRSKRGDTMGSTSKSAYDTNGIAFMIGSTDGKNYRAFDIKSGGKLSLGSNFGNTVHVTISTTRGTGKYTFEVTKDGTTLQGATTAIDGNKVGAFTVLEAYTNVPGAVVTMANITLSYTVPATDADVTTYQEHFDGDADGSEAVIVKTSYDATGYIDKLKITAIQNGEEATKTFERGAEKDYQFDTYFSGGSAVEFAIIVNGVSEVKSIAIN